MYIVATKPLEGKKGVYRFLKCVRRKWFFWSEPVFTLNQNEALRIESFDDAEGLANYVSKKIDGNALTCFMEPKELEELKEFRYYAIEMFNEYDHTAYYCGDESMQIGTAVRKIPQFIGDIASAELFKAFDNASETINRIRQTHQIRCRITEVYTNVLNEYTLDKVIIGLQNKQTKRLRYLKTYNLNGKSSDRLQFVDSMEKAMKVNIPLMMNIVEDIHVKHKIFLIFTHWYDGRDIPASQFKERKIGIYMTMRLKDIKSE